MEWFERLEQLLKDVVLITTFCMEAISLLCVVVGLFKTVRLAISLNRQGKSFPLTRCGSDLGSGWPWRWSFS